MIFNCINFEYHKPFIQQVQLLVRVEQKVILTTSIIRFQYIQKIGYIKFLVAYPFGIQYRPIVRIHKFVESIEGWYKVFIILYPVNKQGNSIGYCNFL